MIHQNLKDAIAQLLYQLELNLEANGEKSALSNELMELETVASSIFQKIRKA